MKVTSNSDDYHCKALDSHLSYS